MAKKKVAGKVSAESDSENQPAKKAMAVLAGFVREMQPLEKSTAFLMCDHRTMAFFCECHLLASTLVKWATTDVPLDPDEQAEYRANREIVEDHYAFQQMKEDALNRRTFSNIVAEYNKEFDEDHPIKIIGGQHRFNAIKEAHDAEVDEWHGVKVYVNLDTDQRLDVQLISNTNIDVSPDLFDRMQETVRGPELRDWCQEVGLLPSGKDFADRKAGARTISVQMARTFITNFYLGKSVSGSPFEKTNTTPSLCQSGRSDAEWDEVRTKPDLWLDDELKMAAREYSRLVEAQRKAFSGKRPKPKRDLPEKALNMAIMSAWAYVAGMLGANKKRLQRHFDLRKATGKDPLNARELAKGRHRSDPENYRGLGNRTDAKERGRLVELFYFQAENGEGITKNVVAVAIAQFHAKQATLDVERAKSKK